MKNLILVLLGAMLLTLSCTKKNMSYKNTATITGPDLTTTMCSGGWWISIDGLTTPTRFDSLPSGTNIDLKTATFPLRIKLNWHHYSDGDPDPCNRIVVDAAVKN